MEFVRSVVGWIGGQFIYLLLRIFGRVHRKDELDWLMGPLGRDHIGDAPYQETAEAEGLSLERDATAGGLVPDFEILRGGQFDPGKVDPRIRTFYENTAAYQMDTWAKTYFPANVALWLLVTTISRKVDQLNFPLEGIDTAHGMTSEIVLLKEPSGKIRYTGWFRKFRKSGRAIYTGFYMTKKVPKWPAECVKVVFPMPGGNSTVILEPANDEVGGFHLNSKGAGFEGAGFYRLHEVDADRVRVWRLGSLVEKFHVYVDEDGILRCDHKVRYLGMPVVSLHYKITPIAAAQSAAS